LKDNPNIRRWYARTLNCDDDPSVIKAAKSRLRIDMFKEIVSREYVIDTERTLEEDTFPGEEGKVELTAAVGVLLTRDQDLEWRIEDCLKQIIVLDDRLLLSWSYDPDKGQHLTELGWKKELERQRCFIEDRLQALCNRRGWQRKVFH